MNANENNTARPVGAPLPLEVIQPGPFGHRQRRLSGFHLIENEFPAALTAPTHWHEHALFCFVLNGHYTEFQGDKTRECGPSTLFFHPGDYQHANCQHTDGRCFNIEVTAAWLDRVREYSVVLDEACILRSPRLTGLFTRLYDEFHKTDAASPLAMEGLLLE